MHHRSSLRGWLACSLLCVASHVWAQLPQPVLSTIFPPGGKVGTNFDVTVGGVDLDEADQLQFTHPGIKATLKMTPPVDASKKPKRVEGQFAVTIDGNVPPGIYEGRIIGRFGATNPRAFAVGTLNELVDAGGNNTAEKAMEATIGSVINGRVDANQFRYYKLALKANERVVFDCLAERLDSRLDSLVSVLNPSGKELMRVRGGSGKDSVAEFTATSEGVYYLRIQDKVYGGGAEHFYRLQIHTLPQLDFIFPPAGPAGSNNAYTVYGRNLPGGQPSDAKVDGVALQKLQVNIPIPADPSQQLAFDAQPTLQRVALAAIEYRLASPNGPSNPLPLYVSKSAVVVETEPNDKSETAQKLTVPTEVAGQFLPQNDADWYQFDAKKGDVLMIEVISHRMGVGTDPFLAIYKVTKDDKGEKLVDVAQVDDPADRTNKLGTDYDVSTDDPSYKLTVAEDGTYRVAVRDQFGTGRIDPRMAYRLAIRSLNPDFVVIAQPTPIGGKNPQQQQQATIATPVIRKGGTTLIDVDLLRMDEFAGEVQVSVEGLPAGMTATVAVAGPGVNSVPLVISAAEGMASWSGPVKIVGKSQVDGKELVREARYAVMVWGSANRQQQAPSFRQSRQMQVSVMDKETEPLSVQAEDKMWETSLGGSLEVPITITRRGDFKDAVKLTAAGLPQEIKPKEINADGNTAQAKLEIPLNVANIKPGVYTFFLRGETKRKYVRNPDAITAAEAEQKEIVDSIAQLTEAQKQTTAAKEQATKNATDAAAKVKEAEQKKAQAQGDAVAPADKALAEAQAALTAANEAKTKAEQVAKETMDKLTQANQMKTAVDQKVTQVKQANTAKDITFSVASTPVKMRIVASPITLQAGPAPSPVKQGQKIELPLTLNKLYGFNDAVEVTFEPAGVQGLAAAKVAIAKDQNTGKFEITAAANTPPGEYQVPVKAKGKFNNINIEAAATVTVKVEPAT